MFLWAEEWRIDSKLLPALTQLIYRGVSACTGIEALPIASHIEDVDITLFNPLTLDVMCTCESVRLLESFRSTLARIDFAEASVDVIPTAPQSTARPDVLFNVSCPSSSAVCCLRHFSQSANSYSDFVREARSRKSGTARSTGAVAGALGAVWLQVHVERALLPGPTGQPLGEPLLPEPREFVLPDDCNEIAFKFASATLSAFVVE